MRAPTKRYAVRFVIVMVAYAVLLVAALLIAPVVGEGWPRYLVMLLPLPAVIGIVWAVLRYMREADEFEGRTLTESLAVGFAGGSVTTFTYGLLQIAGAPALNWTFVWAVYAAWWLIGRIIVGRRYS